MLTGSVELFATVKPVVLCYCGKIQKMAKRASYWKVFDDYQHNVNYTEIFMAAISKCCGELDFSSVKSCLTVGPGDGQYKVAFIKQCVGNTSQLIAVDHDHESVERLKVNLAKNLPNVESQVIETNIERWKGIDGQVDLVLLMNVLYYVRANDRKELYKKMHEEWLASDGRVVVVSVSRTKCPGNACELLDRLGTPILAWEDIESELLEAGFIKQYAYEMQCTRDYSKIDEYSLRFIQYLVDRPVTLDEVRSAVQELFPEGQCDQLFYTLAVFQKG